MNGTSIASPVRERWMLEQECQALWFAMRLQLFVEINAAYHSVFSWRRNINFLQNKLLKVNGRSTVSPVIEPLMLEARGSSAFLSSGSRVRF
jgi:sugar phosphate permease